MVTYTASGLYIKLDELYKSEPPQINPALLDGRVSQQDMNYFWEKKNAAIAPLLKISSYIKRLSYIWFTIQMVVLIFWTKLINYSEFPIFSIISIIIIDCLFMMLYTHTRISIISKIGKLHEEDIDFWNNKGIYLQYKHYETVLGLIIIGHHVSREHASIIEILICLINHYR